MAEMPLAIDLCCGLGGWTDGLLAEGYNVIGFDVERHIYGDRQYSAQLVLQDILTLHGSQFRAADLIVASPPCQEYSYMAMPWTRAKAIAAEYRSGERDVGRLTALFDACFRIQREACAAAGRHIPLVVENVRGAQPWVGRARWNFGSFYLWGDVPALMPYTFRAQKFNPDGTEHPPGSWFAVADSKNRGASGHTKIGGGAKVEGIGWTGFADTGASWRNRESAIKNNGGSWFAIAHNTASGHGKNPDGRKVAGVKDVPHRTAGHWTNIAEHEGVPHRTNDGVQLPSPRSMWSERAAATADDPLSHAFHRRGSGTTSRKAASALIAKIPLPLARHIARAWLPKHAMAERRAAQPGLMLA